ncbi:MAG: enoyl-CoA hydratase/isomerase family protein [Proteobacteria bacterium]|nr:enoyl-CoA hydratase/isomerase family protein [Pseudomonadota bacterium]
MEKTKPRFFIVETDGPIIIWKLNKPPKNLIDVDTLEELAAMVADFDAAPGLRVGIVTSNLPNVFIQHFDVSLLQQWAEGIGMMSDDDLAGMLAQLPKPQGLGSRTGKPVICAVNSTALGGGCELALGCDFRLMARGALIGLPEVHIGIFPGGGGSQRLVRLLGVAKAMEFIMLGSVIDADEAFRIGLVHQVCEPDQLMPAAMDLARRLAAKEPHALVLIKKSIYDGAEMPLPEALLMERALFFESLRGPETRRLIAEYVESGQEMENTERNESDR